MISFRKRTSISPSLSYLRVMCLSGVLSSPLSKGSDTQNGLSPPPTSPAQGRQHPLSELLKWLHYYFKWSYRWLNSTIMIQWKFLKIIHALPSSFITHTHTHTHTHTDTLPQSLWNSQQIPEHILSLHASVYLLPQSLHVLQMWA